MIDERPVTTRAPWVTFLAIALPAVIAFHPLANNDLPMHLAVGDWILEEGRVPSTDPFSANGHGGNWVAHEWLAAVIFSICHKVGGAHGLVLLAVALAALLGWLQHKISTMLGVSTVARLLVLVPLWLVAGRRLMLRPHLLGLCSGLGLFYISLLGRERPRILWLSVPLMALWANSHSSFILGIAFLIFDLLIWPDQHRAPRQQRIAVVVSAIGATLLQPHGLGLFLFPFQLGLDPIFTSQVIEWVSPFADSIGGSQFRLTPSFWIGVPCLAVTLLLLLRLGMTEAAGHIPRAARLATVVAIAMALLQQRHFALAMLLCSMQLGLSLTPLCLRWPDSAVQVRRRAATPIVSVLAMLLAYGYPATMSGPEIHWRKGGSGWSETMIRAPLSILTRQWQVTGAVLCEYEYGSSVVHASDRRLRPTMDSRNTVYGPERFEAHDAALSGNAPQELQRLLALASAVLIHDPRNDPRRLHVVNKLIADGGWALIHQTQGVCQLWVRKSAVPEQLRGVLEED